MSKQYWTKPTMTEFGDVASLTLQASATVKCPGPGDDLANSIKDTNLPVGTPCS